MGRGRRWLAIGVAVAGLTAAGAVPASAVTTSAVTTSAVAAAAVAAPAAGSAAVSINAGVGLGPIPATAFGVNQAVYDGHMNDGPVSGLLSAAGLGAVRYPGGSYADIFHWQTNTADGGYVAPNTSFDQFMTTVKAANAQPVIIANYGSGTAQEAADWVRYANVTKSYGAKYWEIGNEVYGNGYYGSQWENDTHADKSPRAYATNVLQYITAMKAVDPSIKIGVVLTTPGGWPDGIVHSGDTLDWNHTVMSIVGNRADFVIVHWYPGGSSNADMLTKPAQIAGLVSTVRGVINQYAGSSAATIGIAVTETNSTIAKDTSPAALFAPDTYLTFLENGVFNVDWWNLHNGAGTITTVEGATDYGDEGIVSNGSTGEPAVGTPFATYYGIQMITKLGGAGDQLIGATSNQAQLAVHAVRKPDGGVNVMLINKDPANATAVTLTYAGFTPTSPFGAYEYLKNGTSILALPASGSPSTFGVPAYSIVVLNLRPATGGDTTPPTTPGTPVASALTSTGVTLTWAPSTDASPITYDVVRISGATSTVVGSTSSTTLAVAGLTPATAYTFAVRARDTSGNVSTTSGPVSVTTLTGSGPAACSVAYRITNFWPGGFQGDVTIKNTGSTTVTGWTLRWTFANGQTISQLWNGTVTQTGSGVAVTNATWNGALTAGASANVGFLASQTGTNATPTSFTLNGGSCTAV